MRLIDADELKRKIEIGSGIDLSRENNLHLVNAIIDEAPTINPEDLRPKGKWIAKETMVRSPLARNYYCSQCKYEPLETINFCPNCGAKMEG